MGLLIVEEGQPRSGIENAVVARRLSLLLACGRGARGPASFAFVVHGGVDGHELRARLEDLWDLGFLRQPLHEVGAVVRLLVHVVRLDQQPRLRIQELLVHLQFHLPAQGPARHLFSFLFCFLGAPFHDQGLLLSGLLRTGEDRDEALLHDLRGRREAAQGVVRAAVAIDDGSPLHP